MSQPLDHIAFLSQDVGPRPAGTEEEQQAALYITEQFQNESGLFAAIEDFRSESNGETATMICAAITIVFALVQIIVPIMAIPSLLLTALAAVLYIMEAFDRPVLSKMLARGVSQNVVAKYEPSFTPESGGARRRKVILVANYDSGKVRAELGSGLIGILPLVQKLTLGAMAFVPVFILFKNVFFLNAEEGVTVVLNVILIIALVLVAIPVILYVMHRLAPYNEAANCNASGVAVLLELARQVAQSGSLASQTSGSMPVIHGEEAAYAQNLIPEGAQLTYEAAKVVPPEPAPQTEEERLASAKMAIEALTGKSVGSKIQSSVASNLVQVKEQPVAPLDDREALEVREETREALTSVPAETLQEAASNAQQRMEDFADDAQVPVMAAEGEGLSSESMKVVATEEYSPEAYSAGVSSTADPAVPDWYKKAQENAKKPKEKKGKIQRSRYAEALDAAVSESTSYFNQANQAVNTETEDRLRKMRDGIMEVSAPQAKRHDESESEKAGRSEQVSAVAEEQGQTQGQTRGQASQPAPRQAKQQAKRQTQQQAQRAPQQEENYESEQYDDLGSTTSMPPLNVDEIRAQMQAAHEESQEEEQITLGNPAAQSVVLPEINVSNPSHSPIDISKQQRAPLAVAQETSQVEAAKSLLTMLPSIDLNTEGESSEQAGGTTDASRGNERASLKNSLPSLSGEFRGIKGADAPAESSHSNVSAVGSFAAGATGAIKPVGDELLENVDPEDIYIDDVDDSDYDESYTETGALAGPGYVDMPKSRVMRIFDKLNFGKKKNEDLGQSTNEWLDVDDDFDAQQVGAARGSWESFRSDEAPSQRRRRQRNDFEDDDGWEGGAYSGGEDYEEYDYDYDDQAAELSPSQEMEQIHEFRSGGITTEVWFVALGSELANNGGMQAFLSEHEADLKGSIFINLCALGAGDLCYFDKEGWRGKAGASSRMKRYVKKAAQTTGIPIGTASLRWNTSASTVVASKGMQAMTIAGVMNGKPAYCAQGDDVLENIEEDALQESIDFVMELLRSI